MTDNDAALHAAFAQLDAEIMQIGALAIAALVVFGAISLLTILILRRFIPFEAAEICGAMFGIPFAAMVYAGPATSILFVLIPFGIALAGITWLLTKDTYDFTARRRRKKRRW